MSDQNNAPEMPERIWVSENMNGYIALAHKPHWIAAQEYTRADRAAPEGQARVSKVRPRRTCKACGRQTRADQVSCTFCGVWDEAAALTPPPAAPTDNTALVEAARRMTPYVSADGADELNSLRVCSDMKAVGKAPISMLARVPSDECGCPEELWQIDGVQYLIHMENEDGTGEIFAFFGDDEHEWHVKAQTIDHLRAEMFTRHAALASREAPPAAQEPVLAGWQHRLEGEEKWDAFVPGEHRPSCPAYIEQRPLYAAPPPACQQEAVTEKALLQRAVDLIKGDLTGSEWKRACNAFVKDARRVLKGVSNG